MNCEQMRALLDAYIDGELNAEEMRALRDHAAACEDCRNELEAAELLRDALAHMNDDVCVPLEAQAAWRKAVRAEAGKRNRRRTFRVLYGLAAALVVAIGCMGVLRSDALKPQNVGTLDAGVQRRGMELSATVEMDGEAETAVSAKADATEEYAAWKKYGVKDFERACNTLESLVAEYSGTADSDRADADATLGGREAMYRIELPSAYMEDFLTAASLLGTELDSEEGNVDGDMGIILVQLIEQGAE